MAAPIVARERAPVVVVVQVVEEELVVSAVQV